MIDSILTRLDIIIILFTCALGETLKPILFKSNIIKGIYPLIINFIALGVTVAYAIIYGEDIFTFIMKGFINGCISSWSYDLIISKLKKKD